MILHEFHIADVEDPYLYAGFPIAEWQETEKGRWIMERVQGEATFTVIPDIETYGYRVVISGNLSPQDQTYFNLKFA